METDPKKELGKASKGVSGDPGGDPDELALKFLGLGTYDGASEKAKKVSIQRSKDGKVVFAVKAKGTYQLPAPSHQLADRVISIARSITHIDADQDHQPVLTQPVRWSPCPFRPEPPCSAASRRKPDCEFDHDCRRRKGHP
jgi:hypothetical protein